MSPHTMQQVLDRQLGVLYRHLVWDLAAREARRHYPDDVRYTQLRAYPSPPY